MRGWMRYRASRLLASAVLALTMAVAPAFAQNSGDVARTQNANCPEPITVAQFAWPAAEISAELIYQFLRDAYGCNVDLAPAATDRTLAALERSATQPGAIVIAPGLDRSHVREAPDIDGARLFGAAAEGWFAPSWMFDRDPNLRSVLDVAASPQTFAASDGRPQLYICPENWPCHRENIALIERLDLTESYEIVTPASGDALIESLASAYANQTPWVGYAWRPSAMIAAYPLRRLATSGVEICAPQGSAEGARACRTPFSDYAPQTAYPARLREDAPEIVSFLNRLLIPSDVMVETLAWRKTTSANAAQTVARLIRARPQIWRPWLSAEARARFDALQR
ncbi:MAG: glycine betaine ABC transporter substrate-binding protein [Pseudomonadota bacterium]